jgi:hypothetical protein
MIVQFKYFSEKTDADYNDYNTLWGENKDRFVFLQHNFSLKEQLKFIKHNLSDKTDILAVRFPTTKSFHRNKIIKDLISGKGVIYDDNVWHPKEVWVYGLHTVG